MPRLHELYDRQAQLTPQSPAFSCFQPARPRVERSYEELQVRSREIAAGLHGILRSGGNGQTLAPLVAVRLPRTHEDFLPLLVALSRCNATSVLMSTDLRDKELERSRNALIRRELRPALEVSAGASSEAEGDSAETGLRSVAVESLQGDWDDTDLACDDETVPLCLLFTGGTTRGRCVAVTHAMVSHERDHYREVLNMPAPVRVLANTSVYWGASALGQVSIALAYGGCAVFCEASEADDIRAVVAAESADVLGLVPDQLRTLADSPAADLPNLRAIFTWGERLPPAVAERWRSHPQARLRELLISTEYWLALYASPLEDAGRLLRIVRGVQMLIVSEDGDPVSEGEVGELLLAGPMVTSGYVPLSSTGDEPSPFRTVNGVTYFCTRDLVRLHGNLLEFRGRADMMTKEKGKWVDLLAIQEALQSSDGVAEAAVLPNPGGAGEPHAFLALRQDSDSSNVIRAARLALPQAAQVHVIAHFPRHPVTRKVDVKNLQALIRRADAGSWPLTVDAAKPSYIATRAMNKVRAHLRWTLGAVAVAAMWDVQGLIRFLLGFAYRSRHQRTASPVTLAGFLLLPFMHLATLQVIDHWDWVRHVTGEFPMGMWGAIIAALAARGVASPGSVPRTLLSTAIAVWSGGGAAFALSRGRLLAWPVLFWFGIGHRFQYDCSRWTYSRMWIEYFRWQTDRIFQAACLPPAWIQRFGAARALEPVQKAIDAQRSSEAQVVRRDPAPAQQTIGSRAIEAAAVAPVVCTDTTGGKPVREVRGGDASIDAKSSPIRSTDEESTGSSEDLLACDWCQREVQIEWPPSADVTVTASTSDVAGGAFDKDGKAVCWQCWHRVSAFGVEEATELVCRLFGDTCDHEPRTALPLMSDVTEPSMDSRADLEPEDTENQGATRAAEETDQTSTHAEPQLAAGAVLDSAATTAGGTSGVAEDPAAAAVVEPSGLRTSKGKSGTEGEWSAEETKRWKDNFDNWWWYNKTQKNIDVQPWTLEYYFGRQTAETSTVANTEPSDPRLRRVCQCVTRIDEAAIGPTAPLHGLDSLRVSLLTSRLRAEFGVPSLSINTVRQAANSTELLQAIERVEQSSSPAQTEGAPAKIPDCGEYAIYFSPGQYVPMGAWVVRTSAEVDADRMEEATRKLVDRHASLRSKTRDDMRIFSFFLDSGIIFTLAARILAQGSWPARLLRLCASWSLRKAWPRMVVRPREEVYAAHKAQTPFEVVKSHGQPAVELVLRQRRNTLHENQVPLDVALVRLEAQLVGLWVFGYRGGEGDFAILPDPRQKVPGQLIFADRCRGEVGVLVGPGDPRWVPPPYGFPALLCARLAPGSGVVWLRLNKPREAVVLWKADAGVHTRWIRFLAFQMPGAPGATSVFSFLCVSAMHHIADGMSYEATVGDLLAFYAWLAPVNTNGLPHPSPPPPLLSNSLAELERRLFDTLATLDYEASPQQISMRGNLWRFRSKGYGHLVNLQRGAIRALGQISRTYGAPLDALMLALSAAAIARATELDVVPMTLYVPMRDGPGEAGLVGLFADWRNIAVQTDKDKSTVIGVVLDVAHTLRTRRWAVFNAMTKPEATMVNFQPLDVVPPESRAGFAQVGEELWRIGECLKKDQDGRSGDMNWVPQPLSLTIEQQDRETWYIIVTAAYDKHPPAWMRRFLKGFEDAFWALLAHPTRLVHTKYAADFY